jgi:hypothetical protein
VPEVIKFRDIGFLEGRMAGRKGNFVKKLERFAEEWGAKILK